MATKAQKASKAAGGAAAGGVVAGEAVRFTNKKASKQAHSLANRALGEKSPRKHGVAGQFEAQAESHARLAGEGAKFARRSAYVGAGAAVAGVAANRRSTHQGATK